MKQEITADGSSTAYHPDYQQHYHNLAGAWSETLELYGSRVSEHLRRSRPGQGLVDLGFGLGYNLVLLLFQWQQLKAIPQLEFIYSLDRELPQAGLLADPNTLPEPQKKDLGMNPPSSQALSLLRELVQEKKIVHKEVLLKLYLGDARQTLKEIPDNTIAIWLWDPFSPYHNPELWSREIFALAHAKSAPEALLITYSSAVHVRSALKRSGWEVYAIPGVGDKSQATLAYKKPIASTAQGASFWQHEGYRVHEIIFFRDRHLNADRQSIRQNRLARRARAKRLFPN